MDLNEIGRMAVGKVLESGVIEKKIEEAIGKTLTELIENNFSSYSDFGKNLKEKLKKSFNADMDRVSIPEYHTKMLTYITTEIELNMKNNFNDTMKERIQKFFKPLEKDEYKISEIVELYKDNIDFDFKNDCDVIDKDYEITAFVDRSQNVEYYYYLYLDSKPNTSRYQCEYQIGFSEDCLFTVSHNDGELLKIKHTILDGFERLLFNLFSCKTKIINDSKAIDNIIYSSYGD